QHVLLLSQLQHLHPHQRPSPQIEPSSRLLPRPSPHLPLSLLLSNPAQVFHLQPIPLPFIYHLPRLPSFLLDPRPQRLVSSHHLFAPPPQRLQTNPPFHPHRRRAVVDSLPGLQLFYKPQPPLPVRQRRPSLSSHSLQPWPFPLHTTLQLLFHY